MYRLVDMLAKKYVVLEFFVRTIVHQQQRLPIVESMSKIVATSLPIVVAVLDHSIDTKNGVRDSLVGDIPIDIVGTIFLSRFLYHNIYKLPPHPMELLYLCVRKNKIQVDNSIELLQKKVDVLELYGWNDKNPTMGYFYT
jgi:hypothetical protein